MAVLAGAGLDFRGLWERAISYGQFVEESVEHCGLWEGLYSIARVPDWALDAVRSSPPLRLLALVEDWCGDAANTVPILARLADVTPHLELRLLRRDENSGMMDRYLTNGSRSIPIVVVLDQEFRELRHWGPRPRELQAFVLENRPIMPKAELYPLVRKWYARDRGVTTLREVLLG